MMDACERPIRVVVADDSAFIRGIICSHLESVDEFEIVGAAENGKEAVELVAELRPDVLTLDVDMPVMSGVEALESIMLDTPTPIVMVSGVSLSAAEVTLHAIESGAVDFILKYIPGTKLDPEELRLDIISKVRAAAQIKVVRTIRGRKESGKTDGGKTGGGKTGGGKTGGGKTGGGKTGGGKTGGGKTGGAPAKPRKPLAESTTKRRTAKSENADHTVAATVCAEAIESVAVVGASTGGPIAIKQLLARLPHEFSAPIIIVQHIPKAFTDVLAAQLRQQLPFETQVVQGGETLQPRQIYLAPGDQHLMMDSNLRLMLHDGPPICGHRPSIDVTMKSVSQYFPNDVYGVLLTGMGCDGASGLKYIHSRGGRTFVQSSETCVVDGMPSSAIAIHAVDHVASPEGIADKLVLEINRHESRRRAEGLARDKVELARQKNSSEMQPAIPLRGA